MRLEVRESVGGWDMRAYLARLASAEQQHLDLVLRHNLVSPELALDLFITCKTEGISQKRVGRKGNARALASSSTTDDWTQPMMSRRRGKEGSE